MQSTETYYDRLGVSRSATTAEITRAFRTLAKELHPDSIAEEHRLAANDVFVEISEAYDVLKDPEKRRAYDESLNRRYLPVRTADAKAGSRTAPLVAVSTGLIVVLVFLSLKFMPAAAFWKQTEVKDQESLSIKALPQRVPLASGPAKPAAADDAPRVRSAAKSDQMPSRAPVVQKETVAPKPIIAERVSSEPDRVERNAEPAHDTTSKTKESASVIAAASESGTLPGLPDANQAGSKSPTKIEDKPTGPAGLDDKASNEPKVARQDDPQPLLPQRPRVKLAAVAPRSGNDVTPPVKPIGDTDAAQAVESNGPQDRHHESPGTAAHSEPEGSVDAREPMAATPPKKTLSPFAETIRALEADIAETSNGPAAYRLISLITEATKASDLEDAATIAKQPATAELLQRRLRELSVHPGHAEPRVSRAATAEIPVLADCAGCPEMAYVPTGRFVMGSSPGQQAQKPEELPARNVVVSKPFYLSKYKVTYAEWQRCQAGGGCRPLPQLSFMTNPNTPVTRVSWQDAKGYARWLSRATGQTYRLPTEAEWEYAVKRPAYTALFAERGQSSSRFAEIFPELRARRMREQELSAATVVGLQAGPSEWTEDCWYPNYVGAASTTVPRVDPGQCQYHVVRGGGLVGAGLATQTARAPERQDTRSPVIGIRVVREVPAVPYQEAKF